MVCFCRVSCIGMVDDIQIHALMPLHSDDKCLMLPALVYFSYDGFHKDILTIVQFSSVRNSLIEFSRIGNPCEVS